MIINQSNMLAVHKDVINLYHSHDGIILQVQISICPLETLEEGFQGVT